MRQSVVELPAAPRPAKREDRDAGRAERFHVAVHGPARYLEPPGELPPGQPSMRLQQQKSGKQAVGSHSFVLAGPHPRSLALAGPAPPELPPAARAAADAGSEL